jgi:hypothetical protein
MKIFKLKTWIFALMLTGGIFGLIKVGTPNHPEINHSVSTNEVKNSLKEIFKQEANNISFQYLDSPAHGAPVEYIKASREFFSNLGKCKEDKECLIGEYDNFMNEWASDRLRQETRAYFMVKNFGLIGEQINQSLGFMY